jgi:hypothetical protein
VAQRADDHAAEHAVIGLRAAESVERGLDRLLERQPATRVEHGGVADLDVAHAFPPRVLGELVGDPLERVGRLHHLERDVEAGEVLLEVPRVVDPHVVGELLGGGPGHRRAILAAELEQRGRPEGAIEVTVQLRLREAAEQVARDGRGHGVRVSRRNGRRRDRASRGR